MNTKLIIAMVILLANCFLMNFFTDKLGEFIDVIAKRLNLNSSVKGALFDGISSSIPELMTAVIAALAVIGVFSNPDPSAFSDVGVGTIGGSAIFNILIIPFLSLAVTSSEAISKLEINKKALFRDLIVYLSSVFVLYIGTRLGELNKYLGMILVIIYSTYTFLLIKTGKEDLKEDELIEEEDKKYSRYNLTSLCFMAIITLIPIGAAVHFCVGAATTIGTILNIPRLIMALIVLAATTSIPDTLLSVRSAKNGDLDASIANAVGSNSFDICIALGLVLAISSITIKINPAEVLFIFKFLILSSICYTIAFITKTSKLSKLGLLFAPYVGFMYYVVMLSKSN